MLLDAAREWRIDIKKSFMVGDRWSDIVAGQAAGCYTIFIDRGYAETREIHPDKTTTSLPLAAQHILSRLHSRRSTSSNARYR
jgi:D-glycero-D-manno-heptose 1,7-bisphosphate phosphatase